MEPDAPPSDVDGDAAALVERFASLVTHEVRTPLTVVLGYTRVLMDGEHELSSEALAVLARIRRNAQLAMALLDRFATVRSIEDGTLQLSPEETDVGALTAELVGDLRDVLLDPRPVEVQAPDETLVCRVDDLRLRQLLLGLLSFAHRHSPPNEPIYVDVRRDGDVVVLGIADHGEGVAPDEARRFLDRLVQLDAARQSDAIGLYVAQGIAKAHGGEVDLVPAERGRRRFVVRLPVRGPA